MQKQFLNFRSKILNSNYISSFSLLKVGVYIFLVSITSFTSTEAAQRRGLTEDYLFGSAHETTLARQRDLAYLHNEQEENLQYGRREKPLQIALALDATPFNMVEQHHVEVPRVRLATYNIQLADKDEFYRSAVGNQLQLGTCASFAVVDCLLYLHDKTLSPAYLNVRAKHEYAEDCTNNGLNIGMAMKCAFEYGTVMDWVWPYKGYYAEVERANKKISNDPQTNWDVCVKSPYTEEQDQGLVKFAFEQIMSLFLPGQGQDKVRLLRDSLMTNKTPIVISIPVKWGVEWTSGKIRSEFKGEIDGWHAISICGFNDETREFTFKNSWGLKWGTNGFGIMSFDYVARYAREAWTATGQKLHA